MNMRDPQVFSGQQKRRRRRRRAQWRQHLRPDGASAQTGGDGPNSNAGDLHMTTEKQIEANRANAKKSTGPRTEAGKAVSRLNAVTHGLTPSEIVVWDEDPDAFDRFRADVLAELQPEGFLEIAEAERAATILWRLRRVPAWEAALLSWQQFKQAEKDNFAPVTSGAAIAATESATAELETAWPGRSMKRRSMMKLVGQTLEGVLPKLMLLNRYEANLVRQLQHTLATLAKHQDARNSTTKDTPVAPDVEDTIEEPPVPEGKSEMPSV